ncbi:MAG: DUF423 domain-containing protein [Gammaproteobacteria bacterium]|nr:DUF423 domain-containing protein [Gammaproteobacteria bacterium]NNF62301.1 DUF423 domain-containing protein [Gammaproteobacteria bacterium]NNM21218.1 DUF423 domain-containing protein [Gammaproteobacteria bacterium]
MNWFAAGAILAALAVITGAFGAHGMESRVGPDLLDTFETGARYHMYHALALLAVGWQTARRPGRWTSAAGWLFVVGIVVFSGSLYALVMTGERWLGAITPIGGVCFIAGWIALAVGALHR